MKTLLVDLLVRHEGIRLRPYLCTAGRLSIGIGRNLDDTGINETEAFVLLSNDIERCIKVANTYPWFAGLNDVRKAVVICMIFNLGASGFFEFKRMLEALVQSDYNLAAKEMLNSRWKQQVGKRSVELASLMKSGKVST